MKMSGDFPRDPVPAEHATRSAATISLVVINAVIGIPIMILGGSIGRDYGAAHAALVIGIGCALTAVFSMLTAWAGVRSRCSTALLAERSFGQRGARVLNLVLGAALLGWFAVEMGFIGQLLASGLRLALGLHMSLTVGIVGASMVIGAVAIFGISVITRGPLLFVPLLALLIGFIAEAAIPQLGAAAAPGAMDMSIGTGISAVIGGFGIGILILPDYSRFIGRTGHAVVAVGLALGPVWMIVLGAYAAAGLATRIDEPAAMLLALGLPAIVTLFLPLGLIQNGIMCLYSSALATSTLLKGVHFAVIVTTTALIGMILALAGVQAIFVGFLVLTSAIFPPAAAILACEALFGPAERAPDPTGIRWTGLAIWGGGALMAVLSEHWGWGPTGISALDGFVTAFIFALLVIRLGKAGGIEIEAAHRYR